LNHAVGLVGYDVTPSGEHYWIVKNSWGATWGLSGYVYIAKSNSTSAKGICGIAVRPVYPTM